MQNEIEGIIHSFKVSSPNLKLLNRIAELRGITMDDLLDEILNERFETYYLTRIALSHHERKEKSQRNT